MGGTPQTVSNKLHHLPVHSSAPVTGRFWIVLAVLVVALDFLFLPVQDKPQLVQLVDLVLLLNDYQTESVQTQPEILQGKERWRGKRDRETDPNQADLVPEPDQADPVPEPDQADPVPEPDQADPVPEPDHPPDPEWLLCVHLHWEQMQALAHVIEQAERLTVGLHV